MIPVDQKGGKEGRERRKTARKSTANQEQKLHAAADSRSHLTEPFNALEPKNLSINEFRLLQTLIDGFLKL